jgi:hypothetical protein
MEGFSKDLSRSLLETTPEQKKYLLSVLDKYNIDIDRAEFTKISVKSVDSYVSKGFIVIKAIEVNSMSFEGYDIITYDGREDRTPSKYLHSTSVGVRGVFSTANLNSSQIEEYGIDCNVYAIDPRTAPKKVSKTDVEDQKQIARLEKDKIDYHTGLYQLKDSIDEDYDDVYDRSERSNRYEHTSELKKMNETLEDIADLDDDIEKLKDDYMDGRVSNIRSKVDEIYERADEIVNRWN